MRFTPDVLLVQETFDPSRAKRETNSGWLAVQLLMFAVGLRSLLAAVGVTGDICAHQPKLSARSELFSQLCIWPFSSRLCRTNIDCQKF